MQIKNCIFCEIIAGNASAAVVHEDAWSLIVLDRFPLKKAHLLVVPKQHSALLSGLSTELQAHLIHRVDQSIALLKNSAVAKAANVVLNDGAEAGQHIAHVHFHIIPRWAGLRDLMWLHYLKRPWYVLRALFNSRAHNHHLAKLATQLGRHL